jgi:DNA-binding GntR family transcriptional regulator
MKKIARSPIREQLYEWILGEIISGVHPVGTKLRDTDLAKASGVSRTPVREALIRLEREGYLINHLNRGFEIVAVKKETILELYSIIAELEAYALSQVERIDAKTIDTLTDLNAKFKRPGMALLDKITLDVRWHAVLLSSCPNETLVQLIQALKKKTMWFEITYMKDTESVMISSDDHRQIVALVKKGRIAQAAAVLKLNCLRTRNAVEQRR